MGKKGQKYSKFTDEERTEIVKKYIKGNSTYKMIADEYGMSWKTVETMVRKYRTTGTTIAEPKGRNCKNNLTKEDWRERYEILKKYQAFLKAQRERK
jgi:transposase